VTLLDLRMPKLDGVGVIDEIRKEDTSARIIMLTTYDTDNEIYRAIKAGAKGYLLKDARREEFAGLYSESTPRRNLHTASTG